MYPLCSKKIQIIVYFNIFGKRSTFFAVYFAVTSSKLSKKPVMKQLKLVFVCTFLLGWAGLVAQNTHIKKANKLFKLNQYNDAIVHYEAGLGEDASIAASTKLAYCYRMTNRMKEAEQLYASIVTEKKAKPITYFYYGESLMSNSKYDQAKSWFLKYQALKPDDERGAQMAKACDQVKLIQPYFTQVQITEFTQNSDVDDSSPLLYNDGIVFSSDRKSGMNLLKQKDGWTGRDHLRIYYSPKKEDGSYDKPSSFSRKLNELNKHCGPVSINNNQQEVIFTRTSVYPGRGNVYNMQLYSAESENGRRWRKVKLLSFCKVEHNYMHPALSPDGKFLYFISDRPGGEGGTDLFVSERRGDKWGRPQNLGSIVNTSGNEGFPFVGADGKLYFCSKGHPSFGGFDIFFTEQNEQGIWQTPINVGPPINSSYDDISIFVEENGQQGLFASSRNGGDDDIFFFESLGKGVKSEGLKVKEEIVVVEEDEGKGEGLEIDIMKEEGKIVVDDIKEDGKEDGKVVMEEEVKVEMETVGNELVEEESAILEPEEIVYEVEAPYEGSALQIIPTDTLLVEKGGSATTPELLEENMTADLLPELMGSETKEVDGLKQLNKQLKSGTDLKGQTFRLSNIEYTPGSYLLSAECTRALSPLVDLLKEQTSLRIEISGHTSSPGSEADNQQLSQYRTQAIAAYLIYKGIAKDRLDAIGYGESRLLNYCTDGIPCSEEAHKINERVEVRVLNW